MSVRCRVLGPVDVTTATGPAPPELLWRKNLALLMYLARSPARGRTREHLVGLLWPDKEEGAARHSLNEALRVLRRVTGEEAVIAEGGQVRLAASAVRLDIEELERAVEGGEWEQASAIIAGEFLEGFGVPGCDAFEDWLAAERHHWTARSLQALIGSSESLHRQGRSAEALAVARRAAALDPASEPAARAVMTALALLGEGASALAHFDELTERLKQSVGAQPSEPTATLAKRIRSMRGLCAPASPPGRGRIRSERRAPLIGRAPELERLLAAWDSAKQGGAVALILEGDPGTGKTRVLDEVAERARLGGGTVAVARAVEADRSEAGSGLVGLAAGGLLHAPGLPAAPAEALAAFGRVLTGWAERFPGSGTRSEALPIPAALSAVVGAALEEGPILLAIDDAHWLDRDSLLGLLAIHRDHAEGRLAVLLSLDPTEPREELEVLRRRLGHETPGCLIRIGPLDADGLRALVHWALPDYDGASADRLARRLNYDSAGLPLIAVELLAAVVNGLDLHQTAADWPEPLRTLSHTMPGDLPDTVVAAIRISYRRLSSEAQEVLATAAVLGGRVTAAEIVRALEIELRVAETALDELEWQRWLASEGRGYAFVARIAARVVALEMVTPGRRRRLLERAGRLPEETSQLDGAEGPRRGSPPSAH